MTCERLLMSIPRAATSVLTRNCTAPPLIRAITRSRCFWASSPESISTPRP